MSIQSRNNVSILGRGHEAMIFAYGYGCDQNMWRLLVPQFADRYRIILFDLVGCGRSELSAYDRAKYGTLAGHAGDVLEILAEFAQGPAVFVGHSVSAIWRCAASDHGDVQAPTPIASNGQA